MLDPEQDRLALDAALRAYEEREIALPALRAVAEGIADRWRDRANERPPFGSAEVPLWNVVWEVITGCRESLGAGGVTRLRAILDGRERMASGGPELRP